MSDSNNPSSDSSPNMTPKPNRATSGADHAMITASLTINSGLVHVYLAGPLGADEVVRNENTKRAIDQADRLHQLFASDIIVFIPHLYNAWHNRRPHNRTFWFRMDYANLMRCQVLYRMPGESYGSDTEVALARVLGIPVVHTETDLAREIARLRDPNRPR